MWEEREGPRDRRETEREEEGDRERKPDTQRHRERERERQTHIELTTIPISLLSPPFMISDAWSSTRFLRKCEAREHGSL